MKCLKCSVFWLLSLICLPGSEKLQLEQIKESLSNASSSWTSPSFISLCSMVLEITLKIKRGNRKYPCPAGHISSNFKHRIFYLSRPPGSLTLQGCWADYVELWTQSAQEHTEFCTHNSASLAGQSNSVRQDHSQAED